MTVMGPGFVISSGFSLSYVGPYGVQVLLEKPIGLDGFLDNPHTFKKGNRSDCYVMTCEGGLLYVRISKSVGEKSPCRSR